MNKKILNSEETKQTSIRAIKTIAGPVKKTLGPGGNPIIIQQAGQNPDGSAKKPLITKDGVTVAEHTVVRDPAMNTIIQAIMQVAQKTVQDGGDGTTTSVVLAEAIYLAGHQYIQNGMNGIELYNELKDIKDKVLQELDSLKMEVQDKDVIDVARISSNGDEEIAQIVYDAIRAAGEDGYVQVVEGTSSETILKTVEGAVYRTGWANFSPQGTLLVNDKARNMCELQSPAVLIYGGKLDNIQEFENFVGKIWKIQDHNGQLIYTDIVPLLIISTDFSDDIKNKILQMRVQGKMPVAAIKAPSDGSPNSRTQMLDDLAVMLGATVAAKGILDLDKVEDEHLGCAEKVEIGPRETVIYDGHGSKEEILTRIEELNTLLKEGSLHEWDAQNVRLRKGKLSGGIAIIAAGGTSDIEIGEKKDRIEDALCAAKVAIAEGILPGGGYALYSLSKTIESNSSAANIMREALQAPIRQIIHNVGKNADVILSHMPEGKGYDARKKEYVDLMEAGIIDPVKVTKSALSNAVSIAGLLLTTGGALVSDANPEDGQANPLAAMMGM